jgi:hypothetical protein
MPFGVHVPETHDSPTEHPVSFEHFAPDEEHALGDRSVAPTATMPSETIARRELMTRTPKLDPG